MAKTNQPGLRSPLYLLFDEPARLPFLVVMYGHDLHDLHAHAGPSWLVADDLRTFMPPASEMPKPAQPLASGWSTSRPNTMVLFPSI